LGRLEKAAFSETGLTSVEIPSSVEVICEGCFANSASLELITVAAGSKLLRIEKAAFSGTQVTSIWMPSSAQMLK
jgi:hypothetical protein